jgi:hypothetical protein
LRSARVALVAGGGVKAGQGLKRGDFSAHDVSNIHIKLFLRRKNCYLQHSLMRIFIEGSRQISLKIVESLHVRKKLKT